MTGFFVTLTSHSLALAPGLLHFVRNDGGAKIAQIQFIGFYHDGRGEPGRGAVDDWLDALSVLLKTSCNANI